MIFPLFSPLNDRDAQEETPIWIRQHSGPVTKNGPSFISRAWVCSRAVINYLISAVFNQRSSRTGRVPGCRASGVERRASRASVVGGRASPALLRRSIRSTRGGRFAGCATVLESWLEEKVETARERKKGEDRSGASPECSRNIGIMHWGPDRPCL